MFVSSIFAVAYPSLSISSIAFVQAVNLLSGRMIKSRLKSISQPRIVFVSSNRASDSSSFLASIVSHGIGSASARGLEHVSNIRRGALSHLTRLSVPLISTVNDITSPI